MEQDVVNNIFQGRCYSTGFFRRQNRPRILARARYFLPVFFFIVSPWKIFNPHFGNGFDAMRDAINE